MGCHGWMGAIVWSLLDASYQFWRSSCWVSLLGAMLGAVAGVPLVGVFSRCHCWAPLREKIDQSVTPFLAAPFSTLITLTHKLACAPMFASAFCDMLSCMEM